MLRLAVAGAGKIGRKHIDTIRNEPMCELVAVADPAFAEQPEVPCHADYEEMLEKEKPDGVVIATPNALHVPVGLACVERGVPMLVEKPIADTVEGTATLSDAVPAPWSWEIASGEDLAYPRQRENCYLFSGTEGSLALPGMQLWKYEGEKGWYAPLSLQQIPVENADPQVRQMQHFCRVIRGEEAPRASGADATRTLEVVLAIRAAASGAAS